MAYSLNTNNFFPITVSLSYKSTFRLFLSLTVVSSVVYILIEPNSEQIMDFMFYQVVGLDRLRNSNIFSALYKETSLTKQTLRQCMAKNWATKNTTHPNAPINFMPGGKNLLMAISYGTSFCKSSKENLRVIFALSRATSIKNRQVIRNTYAAFHKYGENSTLGNWTLFFIVGRTENETEKKWIENENRQFGDVIIANLTDDYYQITFKTLIGLKVASCFCPNADYVIKTDDDTYIRIKQLDHVIVTQQHLVDSGQKKDAYYVTQNTTRNGHQRFFTGIFCNYNLRVYRVGPHTVSNKDYPNSTYPFFCYGPLYLFRMESVHELAVDCPRHCTGQDEENYAQNMNKYCLHRFEDVFIGSCVSFTQRNKTIRAITDNSLGIYIRQPTPGWGLVKGTAGKHIAVHGNREPNRMQETHDFYRNLSLLY